MKISTDKDKIKELLTRSIENIYPTSASLEKELLSGRRLRVYLGIDPTGPHLHLGHAVALFTLKRFQELGHGVILLVGDFTARIGDPTDKLSPRQPLSEKEIAANMKTFKGQAAKVIRFSGGNAAKLKFNSTWHDEMKFGELIKLAHHFTVQQLEERDMFEKRREDRKPIGLHEFLYPLMQGYDSVALDVDVEVGGNDQLFNMMAGRTLMKALKGKDKFVVATKLLVDETTGKKLSKTGQGLVNLDDAPDNMFGKVMALPDSAITPIAEFSTNMPMDEVRTLGVEKNPRDAKLRVAREVVKTYHSVKEADAAQEEWIRVFSKKELPQEIQTLTLPKKPTTIVDILLAAGVESKSEARRLVEQGAIELGVALKRDVKETFVPHEGDVLKIGKHKFFKISLK